MATIWKHWQKQAVPVETLAYAATLAPNMAERAYNTIFNVALTGALTLDPPTNPVAGMRVSFYLLASGGIRALTVNATILGPSISASNIASGKTRCVVLEYNGAAWFILSDTVQA